jgi:uncharacterized protein (TIGR03435 family)
MREFGMARCRTFGIDPDGTMYSGGVEIMALVRLISGTAGRPVIDRTGLRGFYSVALRYQRLRQRADAVPSADDPPSLFTALQEQLGLKLESSMAQVPVLVIDHIERPDPTDVRRPMSVPHSSTLRLFGVIAVAAVGSTIVVAGAQSAATFEVVSIRANVNPDNDVPTRPNPPDGLAITNYPLDTIVRYAYDVQPFRVIGMPSWALEERFDIVAKASRPITEQERRLMTRSLLVERFRLKAAFETRQQTVYEMTLASADKSLGPGARRRDDCATGGCEPSGSSSRGAGRIRVRGMSLDRLAEGPLSLVLTQIVRTETGVTGVFDVQLSWRPDDATNPDDSRPSLFTALQEQLGVKLTPQDHPVEVLVVQSLQRPTGN